MASAIETPQVEANVAFMVWNSCGVELTIFAITALSGVIVRMLTDKQRAPVKGSGKAAGIAKTAPTTKAFPTTAYAKPPWRDASASALERHRPLASGQPSPASTRTLQTAGGRQQGFGDPRGLALIMDEVVKGVREQPSMKFAGRALTLYSEFRARMSAPGAPTMEQVARRAAHTPAEFFTTVVHCAVRMSRTSMVDGIFEDMTQFKVERTLQFYELAMKQLAGQKQYRQALAAYDRLRKDGLRPSVVTCSCLIGFAAEVGELSRAVEFFKELSSMTTPSIRAYMTVLRVHAKRQDWPASLQVFREMKERGVKPDSLVLNFILATGVSADQVEQAAELVEQMQREEPSLLDAVSFNTIVKGYAQRGNAEGAFKTIVQMSSCGAAPNSITFNTAMDAAVRGGKVAEAWKLLDSMRKAGLSPDKFTCSILVKGCTRSGRKEYLPEVLDLLAEVGTNCETGLLSTLYGNVLEAAAPQAALVARTVSQMRRSHISPPFGAATQRLLTRVPPAEGEEVPRCPGPARPEAELSKAVAAA